MVSVTLQFADQDERDYFMSQLSDGWGENNCDLYRQPEGIPFNECDTFKVVVWRVEDDHPLHGEDAAAHEARLEAQHRRQRVELGLLEDE